MFEMEDLLYANIRTFNVIYSLVEPVNVICSKGKSTVYLAVAFSRNSWFSFTLINLFGSTASVV